MRAHPSTDSELVSAASWQERSISYKTSWLWITLLKPGKGSLIVANAILRRTTELRRG
jgi:hypothetical protein